MRFKSISFASVTRTLAQLVTAAFLSAYPTTSHAQMIVVPGAQAAVEGNIDQAVPFSTSSTYRFQQVYDATAFNSLNVPSFITAVAFRFNGFPPGGTSVFLPSLQFNLSTTAVSSTTLSSTFAANLGSDDTTVFSGSLNVTSNSVVSPKPFDFVVTLSTPFLFNPSAGNLLLDIRNFSGASTLTLDAQDSPDDAVARVVSASNGVNNASGAVNSFGLITRFTFTPATPVPEPSTYGIVAAAGLLGLAAFRRSRR